MALETEIKVRVSPEDLESIRSRLTDLGADQISPRQQESNLLFDFPDGKLRGSDCALRLRTYGEQVTLTFKAKTQSDPLFKRREELESLVGDAQQIQKILQGLGLDVCLEYSKFREIYRCPVDGKRVDVCLDETPVGTFVELEGSSEDIRKLADRLGWTPDQFIQETYVALLADSSRQEQP
ncbi:MAG: class IV adenylate cyclase [Acidobacteriota bacterium]